MKSRFSFWIKKIKKKIIISAKDLLSLPRLKQLKKGRFYGISKKIRFVDQLGSPNPKLVTDYYQKINDLKAAERFGTKDLKKFSFWAWRACGPAVVAMILHTEKGYRGSIYELLKEMLKIDGYLFEDIYGNKDIGWKYSAMKEILKKHRLKAEIRSTFSTNEVLLSLAQGSYVIASLKSRLNPKSGHLVLVTGFIWNNKNTSLTIHDPYTLDGKGGKGEITLSDFKRSFLNRGIIVKNQ